MYNPMFQIDAVLKDSAKSELLSELVDQLLVACSLQLKLTYTKYMADFSMSEPNAVIRLYKALVALFVAVSIQLLTISHSIF